MSKKGSLAATARSAAVQKIKNVVSGMSPSLRKVYQALQESRLGLLANSLQYYRDLGEHVASVTKDTNQYGAGAVELLAIALELSSSTLYKAQSFFINYSEEEYEALVNLRTSVGDGLMWTHVLELLSVANKKKRTQLQEQAAMNSWTVAELKQAVTEQIGKKETKRAGNSGRQSVKPKNTMQGLRSYCVNAGAFVRKSAQVWDSFFEEAAQTPPDLIDQEALQQAAKVCSLAAQSLQEAQKQLEAATKLHARYEAVLAAKAPADADDNEDSDEDGEPDEDSAEDGDEEDTEE